MSKTDELRYRVESLEAEVQSLLSILSRVAGIVNQKVEPLNLENDPRFYWLRNAAAAHAWEAVEQMLKDDPAIVAATNSLDETALHFLVVENRLEAVEFLTKHGSDVNGSPSSSVRPIEEAAQMGQVEMVDLLIRLGAKVEPEAIMHRVEENHSKKICRQMKAVLQSHGFLR